MLPFLTSFGVPVTHPWEINNHLSYGSSNEMGLGVYASRRIPPNRLILKDPVRSVDLPEAALLKETSVYHLLFVDRETYAGKGKICRLHLVVGAISMINHSDHPNCRLEWNISGNAGSLANACLVSDRHIDKGEEIYIDYMNVEEYEFYNIKT